MPKRDLYRILGVTRQAQPAEIKRAYRRIAFNVHPDVGERPDPEHFREVHEAYEILSNPDRRRSYDVQIPITSRPPVAEPLRSKAPITVMEDFLTVRPSIEEVLDHIRQNFFGYREKSGGPRRHLRLEAVLDTEEARFGCRLPLRIPCYIRCPACHGTGQWWGVCQACYGDGIIESTRELSLNIPPGTRDGEMYYIDLGDVGVGKLLLEIHIIIARQW